MFASAKRKQQNKVRKLQCQKLSLLIISQVTFRDGRVRFSPTTFLETSVNRLSSFFYRKSSNLTGSLVIVYLRFLSAVSWREANCFLIALDNPETDLFNKTLSESSLFIVWVCDFDNFTCVLP